MQNKVYLDKTILSLRAKCRETQLVKQAIGNNISIGTNLVQLHREHLFDEACSMLLPDSLTDMNPIDRIIKYRNSNRPQIIKTDDKRDVTFTFSSLSDEDMNEEDVGVLQKLKKMRCDMQKIWKQNVFYDIGEIQAEACPVAWMDFKAFCYDQSLYSMIFIFKTEERMVLGNFHCSFTMYDVWKPIVLKLLTSIQLDERKRLLKSIK